MVIVLPLGLLIMAVLFDILTLITGNEIFSAVAYYNIAAGVLGGLLAAVFGVIDWLAIPAGTRAKSIGAVHGLGNVVVVVLFVVSWALRRTTPDHQPSTLALAIGVGALLLGTVTAWLGGELVYRLGMAVDDGANLDAPSSLSKLPASANPESARSPVAGRKS
jgi:uncharacterized membrane protein